MVYDIEKYTMRSRKLGAAIIGGALGLAGGALGLIGNEREINTNLSENDKNRKFNAEEAEKQRAWSHDEWDYQFGKQTGEWYNQQDYSNEQAFDYWMQQQDYNSPSAQISRLQKTGLNPAHVVGDTTFGSTGLSAAPTSVPNPSVPSAHAASVGLSNPVSVGAKAQAFASMAKGISDVINSVYGSKRTAAETEKTQRTLDPIIQGLLLDNTNKQLINVWQELDNLEKDKGMPDRLANLSKQGKLLISQAMAATSSSDLMNVQKELESLRKSLVSTETNIKGKELLIVSAEAENIQTAINLKNELLRQQANTEKSKQSANYASSVLSIANAHNIEFWNGLNVENREELGKQIVLQTEQMSESVGLTSSQSEVAMQMAENIGKQNDYFVAKFWNEMINMYINTGMNVFGEFTKFKSFKRLSALQQQRITNEMRSLDLQEQKLNKKPNSKSHYRYNSNGELIGYDFTNYGD